MIARERCGSYGVGPGAPRCERMDGHTGPHEAGDTLWKDRPTPADAPAAQSAIQRFEARKAARVAEGPREPVVIQSADAFEAQEPAPETPRCPTCKSPAWDEHPRPDPADDLVELCSDAFHLAPVQPAPVAGDCACGCGAGEELVWCDVCGKNTPNKPDGYGPMCAVCDSPWVAAAWPTPQAAPAAQEPRGCACVVPVLVGGVCECQQPQAAQEPEDDDDGEAAVEAAFAAAHANKKRIRGRWMPTEPPQAPAAEPRCAEFREYCSPGCMLPVGHDGDHVMPQEWYEREITTLRSDLACCEELRKSGESEVGELNAEIVILQKQLAALRAERDRYKGVLERMQRVDNAIGIYPAAVTEAGVTTNRDAFGDGWNAAVMVYARAMMQEADALVDEGVLPDSDGENETEAWRGNYEVAKAQRDAALARAEQAERLVQETEDWAADKLEAARSALAAAQRAAFMAGMDYGITAGGWFTPEPEKAYAKWLAAQPSPDAKTGDAK